MIRALFALFIFGAGALGVGAPPLKSSANSPWPEPVTWGPRGARAWLDRDVVAELHPNDDQAAWLAQIAPTAKVLVAKPTVRLWQLPAELLTTVTRAPAFTTVYRDGPNSHAHARVAVGGVVVTLKADTSVAALARAVAPAHVTDLGGGLALVEAAPGARSVELAARLAAQPGVTAAQPNWWSTASMK